MSDKLVDLSEKIPFSQTRIFLGKYNGFQRYDLYKHPFSKVMERKMRQAFWTPEEISLISDRENFKELPEHIQNVLISNLLFQTLMDSGQNRGLDNVLSELVTCSEWEAAFKTQAFFELIHSLSYSHIIREMFSADASQVFDRVYKIDEIKNRINREIEAYTKMKKYLNKEIKLTEEEARQSILELLIYIFFLEGLKFYISFMVTYTINNSYNDSIPGVTKIIKLINFDEDMHVSVVGGLINILRRNRSEGFMHYFETDWFKNKVQEIVTNIVQDELKWGDYLLSFGHIPSLTKEVFRTFMEYYANVRLNMIGIEPMFKQTQKNDIIEWFELYKDINKDNTAQQEATGISYNIGTMEFDYDNNDVKKELEILLNRKNK